MSDNNVAYLLEKLYTIDKELGGKAKEEKGDKKENEFDSLKTTIQEYLYKVKAKQQERDEKQEKIGRQNEEIISLGIEIRDTLSDIQSRLIEMGRVLDRQGRKPKTYPKEELKVRYDIYGNLQNLYDGLNDVENGGGAAPKQKYQTLTDMKANIFGNGEQRNQYRNDLNAEETAALQRFKVEDGKMERKLDIIIDGTAQWKNNALQMEQRIDEVDLRVEKVTKEVDKTNNILKASNARLKELVKKYRAPNKLCLDITLVLFFLGLIAVIINMAKGK